MSIYLDKLSLNTEWTRTKLAYPAETNILKLTCLASLHCWLGGGGEGCDEEICTNIFPFFKWRYYIQYTYIIISQIKPFFLHWKVGKLCLKKKHLVSRFLAPLKMYMISHFIFIICSYSIQYRLGIKNIFSYSIQYRLFLAKLSYLVVFHDTNVFFYNITDVIFSWLFRFLWYFFSGVFLSKRGHRLYYNLNKYTHFFNYI